MTKAIDLSPIFVKTSGILSLEVHLRPQASGHVHIEGQLAFAVSQTIDAALGFLPPLLRWGLSSSLIHRELKDNNFRFKVGNVTTVDTELAESAIMTLRSKYHNPLARPVGHRQTANIFRHFAKELEKSGFTPHSHDLIEDFISHFSRHDYAHLPFLQLFEGRSIQTPERTTPKIADLTLQSLNLIQDKAGDLVVLYEAQGKMLD